MLVRVNGASNVVALLWCTLGLPPSSEMSTSQEVAGSPLAGTLLLLETLLHLSLRSLDLSKYRKM